MAARKKDAAVDVTGRPTWPAGFENRRPATSRKLPAAPPADDAGDPPADDAPPADDPEE